jgi:hypothetical protein
MDRQARAFRARICRRLNTGSDWQSTSYLTPTNVVKRQRFALLSFAPVALVERLNH